ncbi:phosphohistidine phosphatase [Janibacter sp. Soil728]|uniref:NUDIX hydrolase n=1 Tax=Janibacter sp. Soil728 TaxID=1736393 RepID=UPI0006F580DC|nr:NUDIX hydrolase [Janibacter sp. Soil728]KRE36116.1 phosphohistidine phosphatase [Janibacter sp. Soil728]
MSTASVLAAGTLPWRRRRGRLQVAVIHRPRYDDWSWAKGKLEPGETFPTTAVRETLEETGLRVRLGHPLPTTTYTVGSASGAAVKEVRYWAAEVTGGDGGLVHEVDAVDWVEADAAADRLSYLHDRTQLEALRAADASGTLTTWSLAILRHAKAHPRSSWVDDDWLRPLSDQGRVQAAELVPLLDGYGIQRLVSSPSTRASDTLAPYATASGGTLRLRPGLSEEGYAEDPSRAGHHLDRLLVRGVPACLCSHGPVLPDLVARLLGRVDPALAPGLVARSVIEEVVTDGLAKGEVLIAHVVGTGEAARIVAAERHHPHDRG